MTIADKILSSSVGRRALLGGAAAGTMVTGLTLTGLTSAASAETAATDPLGVPTASFDLAALPRVRQTLVSPPMVPEHEQVAFGGPKIIEVEMTVKEDRDRRRGRHDLGLRV